MAKKEGPSKTAIITVAVIASVLLYLSGVFSGLYANRLIEEQTQQTLDDLKNETQEDIEGLKEDTKDQLNIMQDYISFLETNINDVQVEQMFMGTLSHDEICDFTDMSMTDLFEELDYYWKLLPYRIEEYEKNNDLSSEYMNLKDRYTKLAIRTWVIAKRHYENCDSKIIHGLHFYSRDCDSCTRQGQELDQLSANLKESGFDIVIFTIDIESNESIIKFLKEYYDIQSVPALILNDRVYQGQVFKHIDLLEGLQ